MGGIITKVLNARLQLMGICGIIGENIIRSCRTDCTAYGRKTWEKREKERK